MDYEQPVVTVPKVAPVQTTEKKLDNTISEAFKAQLAHDGISINNPPPPSKRVVTSHQLQPNSLEEQQAWDAKYGEEFGPGEMETLGVEELLNIVDGFLYGTTSLTEFVEQVNEFAARAGFSEV